MSRLARLIARAGRPPVFEARYSGICECCDDHIRPGDPVRYAGSDLVHDVCQPEPDAATTETCERCRMAVSVSGECECE